MIISGVTTHCHTLNINLLLFLSHVLSGSDYQSLPPSSSLSDQAVFLWSMLFHYSNHCYSVFVLFLSLFSCPMNISDHRVLLSTVRCWGFNSPKVLGVKESRDDGEGQSWDAFDSGQLQNLSRLYAVLSNLFHTAGIPIHCVNIMLWQFQSSTRAWVQTATCLNLRGICLWSSRQLMRDKFESEERCDEQI